MTRWWNLKEPNFSQKLPKKVDTANFHKSWHFSNTLKTQQIYWAKFVVKFLKGISKIAQSGHMDWEREIVDNFWIIFVLSFEESRTDGGKSDLFCSHILLFDNLFEILFSRYYWVWTSANLQPKRLVQTSCYLLQKPIGTVR